MARLSILRYPDPRLYTVARPVAEVDARIRCLVDDMLETMYEAEGVGLAATQVDVHERLLVLEKRAFPDYAGLIERTLADAVCLQIGRGEADDSADGSFGGG